MAKKLTPIERLMAAADAYSIARAEANWTNGYRARYEASPHTKEEATRLFAKEKMQWGDVTRAEAKMRREFLRVLRDVAKANNAGGTDA